MMEDYFGLIRPKTALQRRSPRPPLEGSAPHITVPDGFAFTVTLKDDTHAEIHPVGAPPNMKPIPEEKFTRFCPCDSGRLDRISSSSQDRERQSRSACREFPQSGLSSVANRARHSLRSLRSHRKQTEDGNA